MGPISDDLLAILACPACKAKVVLARETWLVCKNDECNHKYPIRDGIPVMLTAEGMKWKHTPLEELPVPPPPDESAISERLFRDRWSRPRYPPRS